jgi:ribosomal subunit interface protein
MDEVDFYVDYETDVPEFTDKLKDETERRLRDLSKKHTDLIGAAVSVTAPAIGESPFLYQARVVVYTRPENIAAVKKDDNVQAALKAALSAIERQVRDKREKLGEPWKRKDIPGNPG